MVMGVLDGDLDQVPSGLCIKGNIYIDIAVFALSRIQGELAGASPDAQIKDLGLDLKLLKVLIPIVEHPYIDK